MGKMTEALKTIRKILERDFARHFQPLREIAYDSANNEYPCRLRNRMYNFDAMANEIYGVSEELMPSSPDALFVSDKIYFIEFKNGRLDTADKKRNLRLKFCEGPYVILAKICRQRKLQCNKVEFARLPKVAVVIYNGTKNPSDVLRMRYSSRFQLDEYNYTLYDQVYVFTFQQFEKLVSEGRHPFIFLKETDLT